MSSTRRAGASTRADSVTRSRCGSTCVGCRNAEHDRRVGARPGLPGKRDRMWPSGPMPDMTTSNRGTPAVDLGHESVELARIPLRREVDRLAIAERLFDLDRMNLRIDEQIAHIPAATRRTVAAWPAAEAGTPPSVGVGVVGGHEALVAPPQVNLAPIQRGAAGRPSAARERAAAPTTRRSRRRAPSPCWAIPAASAAMRQARRLARHGLLVGENLDPRAVEVVSHRRPGARRG